MKLGKSVDFVGHLKISNIRDVIYFAVFDSIVFYNWVDVMLTWNFNNFYDIIRQLKLKLKK